MRILYFTLRLLPILALFAGQSHAVVSKEEPESLNKLAKSISISKGRSVVVTANPHASKAAIKIIKKGGNAIDAAIAAQTVLSVVEPQSSGLGGGTFLMYWDNSKKQLYALDGRETAPSGSNIDNFLDSQKNPIKWIDATRKTYSIGVPGTVALLWESHQRFGKLTWSENIKSAIEIAKNGFIPSNRLIDSIILAKKIGVEHSINFNSLYIPNGSVIKNTSLFKNIKLSKTLGLIAKDGADSFYHGKIANLITTSLKSYSDKSKERNITSIDLANYRVIERVPLCSSYKEWEICTFPPPSGGGIAILQTLKLVEGYPLKVWGPYEPKSIHVISEALKLADSDRNYWINDPMDFYVNTRKLLSKSYIAERRKLITLNKVIISPSFGKPENKTGLTYSPQASRFSPGTTHLVIVDKMGNIVNMTSSIETVFGSRYVVGGMILNNQLTDFSFISEKNGMPVKNRILPDKRPLSSMSPTFVFKNKKPIIAIGTPGGTTIPHYLSKALINLLTWDKSLIKTVSSEHISPREEILLIEKGSKNNDRINSTITGLRGIGHIIKFKEFSSGIAILKKDNDAWLGVADPRREGLSISIK